MTKTTLNNCFKDKVILITGAAEGIGAAVAKSYANHGATVVLLDKNIEGLEAVYDDIIATGAPQPALYPMDLKGANIPDYAALATSIQDNFGRLDGVLHNAATLGQSAPIIHQDPTTWLETMHVNLTATFLLTRACLPLLQATPSGKSALLFTTDAAKDKAYRGAYGISKAGIESLSQQLADELENDIRVHVQCIDPGTVNTSLFQRAFPGKNPKDLPQADAAVVIAPYLLALEIAFKA